jgi:hypothetical protein
VSSNIVGHPIVVGVDGSASALHVPGWAANEAALRGEPLRLVRGVDVAQPALQDDLARARFASAG